MKQNITNVTVAGHRFTVMHTSPLPNAFSIYAIYIGDHPDDIRPLLLNNAVLHGIIVALADANATPNPVEDPSDLAMFSDTEARAVLELFDATEARAINESRSA